MGLIVFLGLMCFCSPQMFEYSIEQKQYTDWSRTVQRKGLHRFWVERDTPCLNVMFNPQNPSHVILHDMYMLCIIDQSLVRQTQSNSESICHSYLSLNVKKKVLLFFTKLFLNLIFLDIIYCVCYVIYLYKVMSLIFLMLVVRFF